MAQLTHAQLKDFVDKSKTELIDIGKTSNRKDLLKKHLEIQNTFKESKTSIEYSKAVLSQSFEGDRQKAMFDIVVWDGSLSASSIYLRHVYSSVESNMGKIETAKNKPKAQENFVTDMLRLCSQAEDLLGLQNQISALSKIQTGLLS